MSWLALHLTPQAMQNICGHNAEEAEVGDDCFLFPVLR